MRVLVIEDDADVAAYIVKALTEAGHNPSHADNGKDGLVMATADDFDVLVVDRMLPGPDGLADHPHIAGIGRPDAGPDPERPGARSTTGSKA